MFGSAYYSQRAVFASLSAFFISVFVYLVWFFRNNSGFAGSLKKNIWDC